MKKIIIGTRGSQLSIIQTEIVQHAFEKLFPRIPVEIKTIVTTGDVNMKPVPLDSIGKGWFTKEIDKELLTGKIDLAVHSLKDLPEKLPEGLMIGAILERGDAREGLVTNKPYTLETLPAGSLIGTDSTRRKATILHKRPDLRVESVRGNVNRRLEKLDSGLYDALILAAVGLERLGMEKRIKQYFTTEDFVPSPGQGALAVVIKKTNKTLLTKIKQLNHTETIQAVNAEREFSKVMGGGCKMPIGAYAFCQGDSVTLYGVVGSLDGVHLLQDYASGDIHDAKKIGEELAKKMLKESAIWYQKINR